MALCPVIDSIVLNILQEIVKGNAGEESCLIIDIVKLSYSFEVFYY